MMGSRYTFVIEHPDHRLPMIKSERALNDVHARQIVQATPGVIRVTEGGRQVWPRTAHSDAQTSGGAA